MLVDVIRRANWTLVQLGSPRRWVTVLSTGGYEVTLRRRVVLVLGAALMGLALAGCARVQPHFALPALTLSNPSFIPTVEAFVTASVASGNTVHLLLNGDQIFPAQLDAIRSARTTITYPQYYYEDSWALAH